MTGLPGIGVNLDRQWRGISLSGDTGPPTDSVRFSVTAPLAIPTD